MIQLTKNGGDGYEGSRGSTFDGGRLAERFFELLGDARVGVKESTGENSSEFKVVDESGVIDIELGEVMVENDSQSVVSASTIEDDSDEGTCESSSECKGGGEPDLSETIFDTSTSLGSISSSFSCSSAASLRWSGWPCSIRRSSSGFAETDCAG